jgi:hypothetical protein
VFLLKILLLYFVHLILKENNHPLWNTHEDIYELESENVENLKSHQLIINYHLPHQTSFHPKK